MSLKLLVVFAHPDDESMRMGGMLAEMHEDAVTIVLSMQGTFYRALNLVNGGRKLETDLFEGVS